MKRGLPGEWEGVEAQTGIRPVVGRSAIEGGRGPVECYMDLGLVDTT